MGRDVPGAEHTAGPTDIVFEGLHAACFDGAGQEIHVETGVFNAEFTAPFAVARHPVGMALKEVRRDRLRNDGFQRSEFIRQRYTIRKTVRRHLIRVQLISQHGNQAAFARVNG